MSAIDLGDVTYEVVEVGEGPRVVLLHGFTGSSSDWAPLADALAPTHGTVRVDLLGHGRTSRATDPARYALERQAADLARVVRHLEIWPAILVGYSYGARIALRLTIDHPALVAGLALESPSAGIPDAEERAVRRAADEALATGLERHGIDAFVERWMALPLFAGEARLPEGIRHEIERHRRANDPFALAAALRGAGQGAMTQLHDRLAGIGIPTSILAGANDATGLARARIVAAGIPGATLKVLEDVGHAPHREAPDRFAAWLAAWLDRIGSPSSPSGPSPAVVPPSQHRSAP